MSDRMTSREHAHGDGVGPCFCGNDAFLAETEPSLPLTAVGCCSGMCDYRTALADALRAFVEEE